MVNVEISGDTRYPLNRKIVRSAVFETLAKNKISDANIEVSVTVVGRRKMDKLTGDFMKDNKKHEVLSFPFEELTGNMSHGFINHPDGVLRLGDIVLCWPYVLDAAGVDDVLVDDEVYMLVSHSVEHLLGKHHE